MVFLNLKQQVFKRIFMNTNFENTGQSELEVKVLYQFHVEYGSDNNSCTAYLRYEIKPVDESDQFSLEIEIVGDFLCDDEIVNPEDKKAAHIQAYNLLFPYAQNMVAQMTIAAGLPPLMIKRSRMKTEDIRIDEKQD